MNRTSDHQILQAIAYAAEKHRHHRRKNTRGTPYVNHPIAVANLLATTGRVTDVEVLVAALLHDVVEDYPTNDAERTAVIEDIRRRFGERVIGLVLECSDDKNLPKAERKRLQIVNAPHKSPEAKLIKIADKTCNLRSLGDDPPADWDVNRKRAYCDWSKQVFEGLKGVNPALEAAFLDSLKTTSGTLAE